MLNAKLRCLILLVIVVALVSTVAVSAQTAITPGTPVESTYSGEAEIYSVEALAGQLLVINMTSEAFDTAVTIQQDDVDLASDDDSGPDSNALLAYVVQADGAYDLLAGASWYDDDTGDYVLTVDVIDPGVIGLDSVTMLETLPGGVDQLYAIIEAAAGDVVNIRASNNSEDDDIQVILNGVDGQEIERDDDDGAGDDALLRRVVLPDDGFYLLTVDAAYSDEPILAPVEIAIESTKRLTLTAKPQVMILGNGAGQIGTEVFTVEVTAGATYRFIVTIEPVPEEEYGVNLELLDSDRFFDPELEVMHATGTSWDFLANEDGIIRLDVHPNFFGTDIDVINYTIALEVIE